MKMSDNHDESFSVFTKVHLSGILFKKSFAPHSNKWSKRFFIVKEGFLLYYSESEKKVFDKKGYFNIHPKGVIPVGGCIIQASTELGQDYVIRIISDSFIHGSLALGTETQYDQDRWIEVLQEAARITWENCRMGESIIRDLESQGLQLNKEKQSYIGSRGFMRCDSVLGIVDRLRTGQLRKRGSFPKRCDFLFSRMFTPALGPTQPHILCTGAY